MDLLKVSGISMQERGNTVLKDINFTQKEFQKIAIAGETGSGKSTLLQIIAGLVEPTAGEVFFNNKKVIGPVEKLVPGHPDIAYLSQHSELQQFLRVEQILRYANKQSAEEAKTLFEICRIDHLLERRTDQLSGGERQRIAMARLLTSWPRLFLLDEPFSNLDNTHKSVLKSVIRDIGEKLEITCILISHDPQDTLSWADEILVLKHGEIIQKGTPEQIYRQPVDEYTAALFGAYNHISPAAAQDFASLPGIQLTGKSLIIRPEVLQLSADPNQGIKGKVHKVSFFGSYYEIKLQLPESVVSIRTPRSHFAEGDTAYLSVSPDDVWYI